MNKFGTKCTSLKNYDLTQQTNQNHRKSKLIKIKVQITRNRKLIKIKVQISIIQIKNAGRINIKTGSLKKRLNKTNFTSLRRKKKRDKTTITVRLEDLQEVMSHTSKSKSSRENLEGRVPS